jgi:hypothetical protein
MSEVKPALEEAGFAVGQTSFGHFSVPRFLSPFRSARARAMDRVVVDIRTAREAHKIDTGRYPEKMSVISHSFGTYVIANILLEVPDLEWDRVIFCGSVVREDFPLQQVLRRFRHPLLNEIGTKDYLPALAESAGWGYGSVGSTGFNRPPVETRWYKGFKHSDFLTAKFCSDFWVPFLKGDRPKTGDRAAPLPFWTRTLTMIPLRWFILAFLIVSTCCSVLAITSLVFGVPISMTRLWSHSKVDASDKDRPPNKTSPSQSQSGNNPATSALDLHFLVGDWVEQKDGASGQHVTITDTDVGIFMTTKRGRALVSRSNASGSDIRVSDMLGESDCFYSVSLVVHNTVMILKFSVGKGTCWQSMVLQRL